MSTIERVLLVMANPIGTEVLRLQAEEKAIKEVLAPSGIAVDTLPAATMEDLRHALLTTRYQIVHISTHGTRTRRLVLETASGERQTIPPKALAGELWPYSPPIQCVLLNACFSLTQGRLISKGLPFTISSPGSIYDRAGIEFSEAFYDAIGSGHPITFAFERGKNAVKAALPKARSRPYLLSGKKFSVPAAPEIVVVPPEVSEFVSHHGFEWGKSFTAVRGTEADVVTQVKRLLRRGDRKKLQQAVTSEIDTVLSRLAGDDAPPEMWHLAPESNVTIRAQKYDRAIESLCRVEALLAGWGKDAQLLAVAPTRVYTRVQIPDEIAEEDQYWQALRWYPAMCLFYAAGIAAVAHQRYDLLRHLMQSPVNGRTLLASVLPAVEVVGDDLFKELLDANIARYTKSRRSEYLVLAMRVMLAGLIPDSDLVNAFDRFEALCWLEYMHEVSKEQEFPPITVGRFASHMAGGGEVDSTLSTPPSRSGTYNQLWWEVNQKGRNWGPLAAGLFGGRVERFKELGRLLETEIEKAWS